MKFKSNIELQAGLEDASGSPGTINQLLSSTATGTAWIDPSTIVAEAATLVVIACKNTSGAAIAQGTPVYQTGTVGATTTIEIAPADALISANKLPAIGLLQTALNNNGLGFVVITGELTNFTTNPIDGLTPTVGDKVFVKSGGGLTLTKPTGEGNGIQNMGLVGKVSGGNAGSITVSSIMRTNDVPNLPEGRIWVGDGNTIVSDTVYVDEPNNRVGIGTISPATKLDVDGVVTASEFSADVNNVSALRMKSTASTIGYGVTNADLVSWSLGGVHPSGYNFRTTGANPAMQIIANGNVGIGTTVPSAKLDIVSTGAGSEGLRVDGASGGFAFVVKGGSDYTSHIRAGATIGVNYFTTPPSNGLIVEGNVGIGTTSPATKLDVDGVITATGGNSTQWNTAYDNSITTLAFSGTSTTTLTLTQQDGGTVSNTFSNPQGTVVGATSGNTNTITVSTSNTSPTVTAVTAAVGSGSSSLATGAQIQTAINTALLGVLSYQGTWNASTNSPTLASGTGTPGYYYIVSTAGSTNLDGITDWAVGDWAVFSDLATDAWQKIDNTQVGNVTGSGAAGRVAYWNSSSNITSDADLTFDGANLTVTGDVTADQFMSTNNGAGFNYKIGDDAWIGDINVADTFRVTGNQNNNNGYITFGNSSNQALGRAGTGALTWDGNFTISGGDLILGGTGRIQGVDTVSATTDAANKLYVDDKTWNWNDITTGTPPTFNQSTTGNAATATSLPSFDTRSTNPAPNATSNGVRYDFKTNTTNGLSDGGTYNGQMTWRSYSTATDFSGGMPMNIAYTANGNLWTRIGSTATTWDTWYKLWSSGNDGAGSGLDADLLDGQQGSYYAPATGGAYLPLAGGTLTGALTGTSATFASSVTATTFTGNAYPYNGEFLGGADVASANLQAGSTSGYVTGVKVFGGGNATPNIITMTTASVERMRITSAGNVGIGTTSPQMGLHVADTRGALFGPSGSGTASSYFSPSDENTLNGGYGLDTDTADIWLNYRGYQDGFTRFRDTRIGNGKGSAIVMVNGSTGNVGIGTTSPGYKLDVSGTFRATGAGAIQGSLSVGTSSSSDIDMLRAGGNYITATNAAGVLYFRTVNDIRMTILSAGNVGIGTTSPSAKLEVSADVAKGILINRTYTTSSQTLSNVRAYYGLAITPLRGGAGGLYFTNYDADTPIIQSVNSSDVAQSLLLNPLGGNVGIGVTGPNQRLQVQTATTTDNSFQGINVHNNGTTGTRAGICFQGYDWVQSAIWHGRGMTPTSESGALVLGTNPNTTDLTVSGVVARMVINNAGAIKFNAYDSTNNTGTPTYLLGTDASGNIVKTNTVPGSAAGPYLPLAGGNMTGLINSFTTEALRIYSDSAYISGYTTSGSARNGYIQFSNGTVNINSEQGNKYLILNTSGGNVGIGTTSPLNKLDVSGGVGDGANYDSIISLSRTSSTSNVEVAKIVLDDFDTNHANLVFRVKTTASSAESPGYYTDALTIKGTNGNVGIGTTSPGYKLDVTGDARFGDGNNFNPLIQYAGSGRVAASPGYSFVGDLDTGMFNPNLGNTLAFTTAGSERMRINSSGNVGIGTTSPATKLEIHGNNSARNTLQNILTINGGTNSNNVYSGFGMGLNFNGRDYSNQPRDYAYIYGVQEASSTSTPGGDPGFTSQLTFYTNTGGAVNTLPTQKMVITATGNVGIGTTSPDRQLTVGDGVNSSINVKTAFNAPIWEVEGMGTSNLEGYQGMFYQNTKTVQIRANGDSYFNGGNVGIGTTSPSSPFTVATDVRAASLTATDLRPQSQLNLLGGGGDSLFIGQLTNSTVYMQSSYFNATLATYPMSLNPLGGNVGIGTTNPRTKTEFASGLPTSIPTYSNTTNGIVVTDGGDIYGRIGVSNFSASSAGYPTYIQAGDWSGATYYNLLLNPNGGNVGIGTTGPTYKLDVSGTGRFTSTVTATNFILSSDERKKTKIKDLSRDNIDISWKSFEMKSDEGEYRVGVIAQELEIKHPEFVNTDNEGFKSVKYIDLLISKIAELEARLEKAGI
jgi:hypothetical protein